MNTKSHFQLQGSVASLRIIGDDGLDSVEVTNLLGCQPDRATAKSWSLRAPKREPADLDGQIEGLLAKLTDNLSAWETIATKYRIDLFCGLFLSGPNQGLSISPAVLAALGARHVELGLDIYDSSL